MAPIPPPQYAAYPRSNTVETYGTIERLEALGEGYFSLNLVFLMQLALAISCVFIASFGANYGGSIGSFVGIFAVIGVCVAVFFITLPKNRKIASGMNWSDQSGIFPSLVMAITWFVCLGALGYAVMRSIALKEMKKYGVKGGAFGLRKKQFQAFVESRRVASVSPFLHAAPPPTST